MLQVAFSCLFVLAGIFILRCDGNARQENYRTWNYVRPAIIIALLVLLYSLVPRVINWIV
jgi:hypothetical protein